MIIMILVSSSIDRLYRAPRAGLPCVKHGKVGREASTETARKLETDLFDPNWLAQFQNVECLVACGFNPQGDRPVAAQTERASLQCKHR